MSNDWGQIYLEKQDLGEEARPKRTTGEAVTLAVLLALTVIATCALAFAWVARQNNANWQAAAPLATQPAQTPAETQPVQQPVLNYIAWDYSYENGMAIARNQNKPVLMNFYTDWCGVCKRMDSGTFVDPAVVTEAQNYVAIKINAEQRTDLAQQYNVSAYPTFVIADGSGNVKYNDAGGFPASEFTRLLQSHR
jgi:thiol:disulfide interchange protein